MKRRWKILIALVVVGLAGFLVWAFNSPSTALLSVRFVGYVTNKTSGDVGTLEFRNDSVLAIFGVTNHTKGDVFVWDNANLRRPQTTVSPAVPWLYGTNSYSGLNVGVLLLGAGEGGWMAAHVVQTGQPAQVTLEGQRHRPGNTLWARFCNRLPWNKRLLFATATSEPR